MSSKKEFNNYRVENGIAFIDLTQGQVAMIDADDLPLVQGYRWHAIRAGNEYYAVSQLTVDGKQSRVRLHDLILPPIEGFTVDHISRQPLDNRRSNLRYANRNLQAQNRGLPKSNTSGHRGVYWSKDMQKWRARVRNEGKSIYLGYFDSIEKAVAARRAYDHEHGILPVETDEVKIAANKLIPCKQPTIPTRPQSGCAGVTWYVPLSKWLALGLIKKERKHLGYFENLEDAIAAQKAWKAAHNIPPAQST